MPNKLNSDRVGADGKAKLMMPGDDNIAAAPSGDDNNPISRVIEPAGPDIDQPARPGGPALADPAAADPVVGDGDAGRTSPGKVRAFAVGADMPPVNGRLSTAGTPDRQLAGSMRSLLTSLGYYTGPEQDEKESVTLARAFTTWLFHHDLPANALVSDALIARMREDLAKGDVRPSILSGHSRKSSLPAP